MTDLYKHVLRWLCWSLLGFVLVFTEASAREIFVASKAAEEIRNADGSAARPFASLHLAMRSGRVQAGDRVVLQAGRHDPIYLTGQHFDPPVEILSPQRGAAHTLRIGVENSSGLVFRGLGVWPLKPPETYRPMVRTSANARDIHFDALDMRASPDAPQTYLKWSKRAWLQTWRRGGARLDGPDNSITRSTITGTAFAITLRGARSRAEGNHIVGFSGDGIRILGDGSAAIRNRIENCVKIDENHDDGIQSWASWDIPAERRTAKDLLVDGNTILEWTAAPHPLRCRLQGIGFFDGMFDRVIIRNNLVVVDHYHGISVYGARNGQIVNNTVVHIDKPAAGVPWILLHDHKNGMPARGNVVANNIAMSFDNKSADQGAISRMDNAKIRYPARVFANPARFDFRPRPDSGLVGAGNPAPTPRTDITGARRNARSPSLGAYEKAAP